jgi:hypothetical protein
MIFDENGTLYFADLENNKIMYRKQDGSIHTSGRWKNQMGWHV